MFLSVRISDYVDSIAAPGHAFECQFAGFLSVARGADRAVAGDAAGGAKRDALCKYSFVCCSGKNRRDRAGDSHPMPAGAKKLPTREGNPTAIGDSG
jgi:hypothetical protein